MSVKRIFSLAIILISILSGLSVEVYGENKIVTGSDSSLVVLLPPKNGSAPAQLNSCLSDSALQCRVDRIYRALPKYKYDKFSHVMVKTPLILEGYREMKSGAEHFQLDRVKVSDYEMTYTTFNGVNANGDTLSFRVSSAKKRQPIMTKLYQSKAYDRYAAYADLRYRNMIESPSKRVSLAWTLPEFKSLEDVKLKEITDIPNAPIIEEIHTRIEEVEVKKTHWLHIVDGSVQFSQAYLSPNWYQGGVNNLSLVANFLWNVKLNEVYHPNLLFENNVQYKLGLYSTPQDEYHDYSISEDLFQWNMKGGVKAFKKWFYSFTLQFKTQLFNNYPQNSQTRTASFLSPADLNVGVGMTYSTSNKSKTLKFNASISPLSYNLKTCMDRNIDPTQFNIEVGKTTASQIGSNAELVLDWNLAKNINYRSRLFLFSNYQYFLGDWENTISFSINKFLSTQVYVHLRYDSSSELSDDRWKHWMLKEILSFGFQYKFSTKI